MACLSDLRKLVTRDPVKGREQLRNFFKDRSVTLRPQDASVVTLKGEVLPMGCLVNSSSASTEEELRSGSSGGRI